MLTLLVTLVTITTGLADDGNHRLLVAGSEGVTLLELDPNSGTLKTVRQVSGRTLTWMHLEDSLLLGTSTLPNAKSEANGSLCAFRMKSDGSLSFLNEVSSLGKTAIHVAIDPSLRFAMVANFRYDKYPSRGSLVTFKLSPEGRIGKSLQRLEHPGKGGSKSNRQWASHPHSVVIGPDNEFVAVGDLGIDKVLVYRMKASGAGIEPATEIIGRPGQQPRHLAWHPNGKFLYCMNEGAATVSVARFDRSRISGEFIQHARRISGRGGGGADIQMDSKGRFLYGTNRGEDTIVTFAINETNGRVDLVGHVSTGGPSTRSIAVAPDDQWLIAANQGNDLVKVFGIDDETGRLRSTEHLVRIERPGCVLFIR